MLPKIVVLGKHERKAWLSVMGLSPSLTMGYEGSEGKIDGLRHFINFGINVSAGSPDMSLVIWDADRLSQECQAVLLKPLEESSDKLRLFLVVTNENSLLPTVLSRCNVTNLSIDAETTSTHWKSVLECFSKGPAKALAFADSLDKQETENALREIILRLYSGLTEEVNNNRLKILKSAVSCLSMVEFTNVNHKLVFGNFLINSWRAIKA